MNSAFVKIWTFIESSSTISNVVAGLIIIFLLFVVKKILKILKKKEKPREYSVETKEEQDIRLTDSERILVTGINKIHKFNDDHDYNFENSYKMALNHIRNKPSKKDWHNCASLYMANAIQGVGIENFFNSFEISTDPKKQQEFKGLKDKIRYCYKRLQNMRHIDKNGELREHMVSEYRRKISEDNNISDEEYQQIFIDFQNLILRLLHNFKLKEYNKSL